MSAGFLRFAVSLFLLALVPAGRAFSQSLEINVSKAPLETVFRAIEKQSPYRFIYVRDELSGAAPVTLDIKTDRIEPLLARLFENQPLSYTLNKNYVSVFRREATGTRPAGIEFKSTVRGRVVGEAGEPVSRATVTVKGTGLSTATDENGDFNLGGVNENAILIITSVGYTGREVIADKTGLVVRLAASVTALDETVVIAYGTTTKRLSTGNVSKVSAEQISNQPVSNPLQALEGRVAGLNITQSSGVPGSSLKVEIRGQTSLDLRLSRNDPLFVIDGVPYEAGNLPFNQLNSAASYNNPLLSGKQGGLSPLNVINPASIESIEVLKDADATAIYGSRGANGVILITTKKGKAGKATFTVDLNTSFSKVTRTMDLLTTAQYVQMRREAFGNDAAVPNATTASDLLVWDSTRYTDFKRWLTGGTARATNAEFSFSGGAGNMSFLLSGGYRRETTVFPGDLASTRGSVNVSLSHASNDKRFRLSFSGGFSASKNNLTQTDLTTYINLPPNLLLYDSLGKPNWSEGGVNFSSMGIVSTPAAELYKRYAADSKNLLANVRVEYLILPGLRLKTNFGYNLFRTEETSFNPLASKNPQGSSLPSSDFANASLNSWIVEPQAEYNRQTVNGRLSVLLGTTFQDKGSSSELINARNFTNDLVLNTLAAAGSVTATNNSTTYRYTAVFGRAGYVWKEKLLANISARRDGSSRFGPDSRFASFGAVGLGWIFSEEAFLKHTLPFLSYGKVRGSYGVTGNDQIGDYKFLNLWASNGLVYQGTPGLRPVSLYNPDYNWERNKKLEAALELGFCKDRILLTAAYYRNRSSNQLISYSLPMQTGFSSVAQNLGALVQNTGWELELTARTGSPARFRWSGSLNLSLPRNRLLAFPGLAASSYAKVYREGQSLNLIYGYHFLGVNPATGVYAFDDLDKDNQLTYPNDYRIQGNRDPKFYGGFLNTFQYKCLRLDVFLEFKKQRGITYLSTLAGNPPGFIGYNQPAVVLERWQRPGQEAPVQQFTQAYNAAFQSVYNYLPLSDGIYGDASYLRLKNLAFSCNLSGERIKKWKLQNARIYLQAQNLLTLTRYRGADPETQNLYVLPPLKTLTAGIQLTF